MTTFDCFELFDRFDVDNVGHCPNCAAFEPDWSSDDLDRVVRTDARWLWTNAPEALDYDLWTVQVGQGVHNGHPVRLVMCESEYAARQQADRYMSGLFFARDYEEGLL